MGLGGRGGARQPLVGDAVARSSRLEAGVRRRAAEAVEPPIAIVVNGEELPRNPAPRIVGKGGGRLVVPVVRIYSGARHRGSRAAANAITASAPGKRIVLHIGSAIATIDGRPGA